MSRQSVLDRSTETARMQAEPTRQDALARNSMRLGPYILLSLLVIGTFFGGLTVWSFLAPLQSATIAPGSITVDGNRKSVQHLEGGIVKRIAVRDGSLVQAGDPLIVLDDTRVRAERDAVRGQMAALLAEIARLSAERDKAPSIETPAELRGLSMDTAELALLMESQKRIFETRNNLLATQEQITGEKTKQLQSQISGLYGEIKAQEDQLKLIREEAKDVQILLEKGYARKPRLLALQREAANIEGRRAQNLSQIASLKKAISEAEYTLIDTRTRMLNEVVNRIQVAETEISNLRESLREAEDALTRSVVRAPVGGVVVNLAVFTDGGVVNSGDTLMDIVPADEKLVIDARVQVTDVENVKPGMKAEIRLSGFRQDEVPVLFGTVETVSADSNKDERTGEAFYTARVAFGSLSGLPAGKELQPGMPAEALILTGERTVISYLMEPLTRSFSRALREG